MPKLGKTNTRKNRLAIRTALLIIVGVAGIYLTLNWLVLEPLAIRSEQKQFEEASLKLEKLAQEIESLVGPADARKENDYCQRPHQKYTRGPLRCVTGLHLLYESLDTSKSTETMRKLSRYVNTALKMSGYPNSSIREFDQSNDDKKERRSFHQSYEASDTLSCSISYTHPVDNSLFGVFGADINPESLQISLACSNPAKAEHYPLRS